MLLEFQFSVELTTHSVHALFNCYARKEWTTVWFLSVVLFRKKTYLNLKRLGWQKFSFLEPRPKTSFSSLEPMLGLATDL